MSKDPCPDCRNTCEVNGDACKRCADAAELEYQDMKYSQFVNVDSVDNLILDMRGMLRNGI